MKLFKSLQNSQTNCPVLYSIMYRSNFMIKRKFYGHLPTIPYWPALSQHQNILNVSEYQAAVLQDFVHNGLQSGFDGFTVLIIKPILHTYANFRNIVFETSVCIGSY